MANTLDIQFFSCSEQGPKEDNEDTLAFHLPEKISTQESHGAIALVADGMSGGYGKTASRATVRGFIGDYYSSPDSWTVNTAGQRILSALNSWVYAQSQRTADGLHMGCTFSAVIIKSTTAHLLHVGDSRIYRLRDGDLEQVSHDHRMVRGGSGGKVSYLTRAVGIEPTLAVDYRDLPVERGDRFLICTDGVHDFLDQSEIRSLLRGDLDQAAQALVRRSLAAGGSDNSSCIVFEVRRLPLASPDEYNRRLSERPFPPELDAGMEFDGFQILREIHASRRSQLYLARDLESQKEVVLKTPSVNFEDDPVYIDQFVQEEWVGRRLNNSHIIKPCPPTRKRHYLYHVLEWVNGQTLRDWIRINRKPPIEDVQNILRQVAAGLQAFHRLEMVHRDLKPDNIMLDQQGQVKIIDFGSTFIAGMNEISVPVARQHLVGTENYTAPECHLGHAGSPATDIFSLGVIAYEMLTGELPYGENPPTKPGSCKYKYQPAFYHNPMVPLWLDGALQKAVRCDPQSRYDLLSEFVQDLTQPNSMFMRNSPPPLIERNPVRFWQGIAGVLLFLNGVLIWLLSS